MWVSKKLNDDGTWLPDQIINKITLTRFCNKHFHLIKWQNKTFEKVNSVQTRNMISTQRVHTTANIMKNIDRYKAGEVTMFWVFHIFLNIVLNWNMLEFLDHPKFFIPYSLDHILAFYKISLKFSKILGASEDRQINIGWIYKLCPTLLATINIIRYYSVSVLYLLIQIILRNKNICL